VHQLANINIHIKTHGATIKIINAQQAKPCTNYKNTKLKLLETNAAIWFNKMCRITQLKPNYIKERLIFTEILKIVTLARFKYELPDYGHRPKHVAAF
jgi:hypothetical protein